MNPTTFLFLLSFLLFLTIGFTKVAWVPTRKEDFSLIASLAKLKKGMKFYDLGSGTGTLLFFLAKNYGVKCIGIEISPVLYLYSKLRSLFHKNVEIRYGNLFWLNLKEADVIYFFLHPKLNPKIEEKIKKEAKKGTLVISAVWPLSSFQLLAKERGKGGIYYYLYQA